MKEEKLTNADKIAAINERYYKMTSEEKEGLRNKLIEHNAFSNQFHGGIELMPTNYWHIIKLELFEDEGAAWEKFDNKQEAIDALNSHHLQNQLPIYDELDEDLQNSLIFEAPGEFQVLGDKNKNIMSNNLTHSEQLDVIKNTNFIKQEVIENLTPKSNQMIRKRYPNSVSAILDHERHVEEQILAIVSNIQGNIANWSPLELGKKAKKPNVSIAYHSEPKASTVDAIYSVLNKKSIISIATVLHKSHPILEPNYNKESDGRRKPINSNEVHGVYTTSNPKDVLAKMARLGFDNQPIYCNEERRCVAMITLKESVKFLTMGALEQEDFKEYRAMKTERLLREPPPMFTPFDSVELAVSLFNAGCESVLFNFDSHEWAANGGDPEVSEILDDGIHIFTPHDVVAYFTE